MMREGHGLVICVRRSLRDVFKKVPTHSIEVQVKFHPQTMYQMKTE